MPEKPTYEELEQRVLELEKANFNRKKAEKALEESEERFRLIAETIDDVFWMADVEIHELLYVSPAYEKIWGQSRNSLYETPRSILDSIHAEDRERVFAFLLQKNGQSFDIEYRIVRPDGAIRWIWDRGFPVQPESGPVIHYTGVAKDITERKRTEKELEEVKHYYRAFFAHGMDGIVILDTETTRPVDFNDRACLQLGYSREEFTQLRLADIDAYETEEATRAHMKKVVENGFDHFETLQRTRQGEIRHIYVSAQVIDLGLRQFCHCIWRDITDRKLAEETIRDSENRFRSAFMGSPVALAITTQEDGVWISANQTELEMFGYTREELIGKSVMDTNLWDDQNDRQRLVVALVENGEVKNEKTQLRRKDGSLFFASVSANSLTLKGVKHILFATEDITERMRAEETIKASLQEKEVLLREIHHRVKNNMQVISSLLFLQAVRAENEQARHVLLESQQRINAMAMIHETIYGSENLASIELSSYLKRLVNHLQGLHSTRTNIRIALELDKVNLDINQAVPCSLILNELISNAFEHAFPDGRKGTIQIKVRQAHDSDVVLEVSDDGVGLTADQDLSNPSTLGLRLVQGLLKKQLKGSLDVVREGGTAFTLRWPLQD